MDAVPPESVAARHFQNLVKLIVAGKATAQQEQQARNWLVEWRDNDARLQPLLKQSSITETLVPVSRNLKDVAVIGLQSLEDLQHHRGISAETRQLDLQQLKDAEELVANLRDMIAPSVELLVQATPASGN